jgi:hypothetical protein
MLQPNWEKEEKKDGILNNCDAQLEVHQPLMMMKTSGVEVCTCID